MEHRILSCVPEQLTDFQSKINWIENQSVSQDVHIIVTPQEFFGGAVQMSHKRDIHFDELFPILSKICKKSNTGLIVGVQERDKDGSNRSAIWFINEKGKYMGRVLKFALPRYDHVATKGFGNVTPEDNFDNRFKVFKIHELFIGAVFCWEAYSDILWTGLSLLKPDLIVNMIKFGANAWPTVKKERGLNTVVGFGLGRWAERDDGGWIERLVMANKWQVKCPIICSTNSWNLNPRSLPMCGMISHIDGQGTDDFWIPKKEDGLKAIPEKIVISTLDEQRVRGALQNKFSYRAAVGEWPPFSLGKYTMHLKINRIEDRLLKKEKVEKPENNMKSLFEL